MEIHNDRLSDITDARRLRLSEEDALREDSGYLAPGTIIDGIYKVTSLLGSGGMSDVYRCEDMVLKRSVAVKLLRADVHLNQQALLRFQREGKAVALLRHPGIVQVYSLQVADNKQPYLVLEIVPGISLAQLIATKGSVPVFKAVKIIGQICDALQHAHDQGVIHRDLKPSNIMLVNAGKADEQVKLLDFGIAKIVADNSIKATQTGEVFGSPAYMSPEQSLGKPVDARSDQYSLACVIFELLTGQPPFVCDAALPTIMAHVQDQPPTLSAIKKQEFPAQIEQTLARMLAKNPADRFATISDAHDALAGKSARRSLLPMPARSRWLSALAVVALIIICSILWTFNQAPRQSGETAKVESPGSSHDSENDQSILASSDDILADGSMVLYNKLKNDQAGASIKIPEKTRNGQLAAFKKFDYASRKIKKISFQNCTDMNDDGLECLLYMPNLEDISLNTANVSNNCMKWIKQVPQLKRLDLYNDAEIDDKGVAELKQLHLKELFLKSTSVDGSVFQAPGNLKNLAVLNLDSTKARAHIRALLNLQVRELYLDDASVQDSDLDVLAKMTSLHRLHLEQNPITDAGLMKLTALPDLQCASVRRCHITESGALRFQKAMSKRPGFEFYWQ